MTRSRASVAMPPRLGPERNDGDVFGAARVALDRRLDIPSTVHVHVRNGVATHIRDLTRGRSVAAAFDFVGNEATFSLAVGVTRSLGKVSQIGLAGGAARMKVLENTRFEVLFEATLWGTIKELREVITLAESGQLTSIPIEVAPLDRINDVYARLKRGEVQGRAARRLTVTYAATVHGD